MAKSSTNLTDNCAIGLAKTSTCRIIAYHARLKICHIPGKANAPQFQCLRHSEVCSFIVSSKVSCVFFIFLVFLFVKLTIKKNRELKFIVLTEALDCPSYKQECHDTMNASLFFCMMVEIVQIPVSNEKRICFNMSLFFYYFLFFIS